MSKDFNNQRDLLIAIREGKIPSERSGEYLFSSDLRMQ